MSSTDRREEARPQSGLPPKGNVLTANPIVAGDQAIPGEDQEADTLHFAEGTTFRQGPALFTFEVENGVAQTLRHDVAYGYSVLSRRP